MPPPISRTQILDRPDQERVRAVDDEQGHGQQHARRRYQLDHSVIHASALQASTCLFDPQLLHAIPELPERHPQQFRRPGLVVAGLFQRTDDGLALDVLQLALQPIRPAFPTVTSRPAISGRSVSNCPGFS